MTARLSPAATLLRQSKLFALPSAIAHPAAQPSSEPVAQSDTATAPWPVRAALETPGTSQNKGDWGLKRPLPLKSTTKSGSGSIRVQRGIDTGEHIADFESAGDHVLTLQKWQTFGLPVGYPRTKTSSRFGGRDDAESRSVFDSGRDNTADNLQAPSRGHTGIWPDVDPKRLENELPDYLRTTNEQAKEYRALEDAAEQDRRGIPTPSQATEQQSTARSRWRYQGPWLAGMTDMEFDAYLKQTVRRKRTRFRHILKAQLIPKKILRLKENAMADGRELPEAELRRASFVTEEELDEHIRDLRSDPDAFGRLITELLDLPEGPREIRSTANVQQMWENGRDTAATPLYKDEGPPRSHPSAGLSYLRSSAFADNDPVTGPQSKHTPVVGRILKTRPTGNSTIVSAMGVGGFVTANVASAEISLRGDNGKMNTIDRSVRKVIAVPEVAALNSEGKVEISVSEVGGFTLQDNKAIPIEQQESLSAKEGLENYQIPQLDGTTPRSTVRRPHSRRSNDDPYQPTRIDRETQRLRNSQPKEGQDLLEQMEDTFGPERP